MGHYKDIPTYALDIVQPPVDANLDEVKGYYVKYQTEQLKGLVDFLEKETGRRLDLDRLSSAIDTWDEMNRIWWGCNELRKAIPGPMPSEDHFSAFVPARFQGGKRETVDFYREMYDEIRQRVENKTRVVPDEEYRLLWAGGLPPWHNMWIFNYFESTGAVFVIETAYRPVEQPVEIPGNITHPLERIAWRTFLQRTDRYAKAQHRSHNPTVELMLDLVDDYRIDGMVMHVSKSCRATSMGQLFFKDLALKYVKIPSLQLTSDIIDARYYSRDEWTTQIDTFLEMVDSAKRRKE